MRLEYKYLIPSELLPELRAKTAPFVEADAHNRELEGYTVRSIYFDTAALSCYHDTVEGSKARKKFRIRGYDECEERGIIFLEIKRKYGTSVVKNRAPVLYEHIEDLLASGDVERYVLTRTDFPNASEDARRFLFHIYGGFLRPIVLIMYEREAYYSRFGSLRITFDKNLRSSICPSLDALFSEENTLYSIPKHFILELKFCDGLPSWLRSTVGALDLEQRALSKYAICLGEHYVLNGSLRRSAFALFHAVRF
jgi:hypothetical protein